MFICKWRLFEPHCWSYRLLQMLGAEVRTFISDQDVYCCVEGHTEKVKLHSQNKGGTPYSKMALLEHPEETYLREEVHM